MRVSSIAATLMLFSTSIAAPLPDNGTPECEYAQRDFKDNFAQADEDQERYPQADKIMDVAYSKADWYQCRNCKSGYKQMWDSVIANDKEFHTKIANLEDDYSKVSDNSYAQLQELLTENRGTLSDMRDVWEKFRRQSNQEKNAVNSINLRYRYYDDTEADLVKSHEAWSTIPTVCAPIEPVSGASKETPSPNAGGPKTEPSVGEPEPTEEQPVEEPVTTVEEPQPEEPVPEEQPQETDGSEDTPVDEEAGCPEISESAMLKVKPLIEEEVKDKYKLSFLMFLDATIDNTKKINEINENVDGALDSISKTTIRRISDLGEEFEVIVDSITQNQLDLVLAYDEIQQNIFQRYEYAILLWTQEYYRRQHEATAQLLADMEGGDEEKQEGLILAQTSDYEQIKTLVSLFEFNPNYEISKGHLEDAWAFLNLMEQIKSL